MRAEMVLLVIFLFGKAEEPLTASLLAGELPGVNGNAALISFGKAAETPQGARLSWAELQ